MRVFRNACLLLLVAGTVVPESSEAARFGRRRAVRGGVVIAGPSMGASPSMMAYYPSQPRYAAPPNYLDPVAVRNPNAVPVRCLIDGRPGEIAPGQVVQLGVGRKWLIEFDRGAGLGTVRYTMSHGLHEFVLNGRGWDLRRLPSGAGQPVSRASGYGYGPPANVLPR